MDTAVPRIDFCSVFPQSFLREGAQEHCRMEISGAPFRDPQKSVRIPRRHRNMTVLCRSPFPFSSEAARGPVIGNQDRGKPAFRESAAWISRRRSLLVRRANAFPCFPFPEKTRIPAKGPPPERRAFCRNKRGRGRGGGEPPHYQYAPGGMGYTHFGKNFLNGISRDAVRTGSVPGSRGGRRAGSYSARRRGPRLCR